MQVKTTWKPFPPIGSACDPRSPGLHVSTIIQDMAKRLGYINESDWEMETTWGAGLLFEIALEIALGEEIAPRIGELEKDGILLTPDGYDPLYKPNGRIHEYKFTWKSVNNNIVENNFMFMSQTKAYCYVMGTNDVIFYIFYCMGDWRHSGPQYAEVEIKFSDLELQENWSMLLKHAELMRREGLC